MEILVPLGIVAAIGAILLSAFIAYAALLRIWRERRR